VVLPRAFSVTTEGDAAGSLVCHRAEFAERGQLLVEGTRGCL
jgi:hypothetical protein